MVNVDPNGPAAEYGVKTGDVILTVGGKEVASAEDVQKAPERGEGARPPRRIDAGEDRERDPLHRGAGRQSLSGCFA